MFVPKPSLGTALLIQHSTPTSILEMMIRICTRYKVASVILCSQVQPLVSGAFCSLGCDRWLILICYEKKYCWLIGGWC